MLTAAPIHCARIAVYVAPDGRSRSYPVPNGVAPASVHHWHGTPFTLTAVLTTLPTQEARV
jgi:hypothetical protein